MTSAHRRAAHAAAIVGFSLVATSAIAQPRAGQEPPQRGGTPRQETPYIIVATFRSPDRLLGVQAADEVRKRISDEHSAQELFVVVKRNIDATLSASGYRPDSALSPQDAMELARQLHGEYVLDASASKSAAGVRIEPRLMLRTGQTTFAQPLPAANGKDAGDAAKMVEHSLSDALKGIGPYKACVNDLRAQKWDAAVKDAALGIQAYPNSALSRMCLLTAINAQKVSPDSIISVSNAILAIDSVNTLALGNTFEGYKAKGDNKRAVDVGFKLLALEPNNGALRTGIIALLVQLNDVEGALKLIDLALKDNPGDAELLSTKWKLLLAAARYKQAIAAGEETVRADTSLATIDYFNRQLGAAQRDSNPAMVQQMVMKASQKFPKEPSYLGLLIQGYIKGGQLPQALDAARRLGDITPKSPTPWIFILAIQNQLNQPDSMIATAQKAIAAGVQKDSIGPSLLGIAGPAIQKAQESKERADWEAALKAAQTVDAIVPSSQTKFYVGFTSYNIGADAAQSVQKLYNGGKGTKDDKAKACLEIKVVEDNLATTQIALPAGGQFDPKTAGAILGNLGPTTEFISQVKAALKCK